MPQADVQPLREILHAACKRYLTVRAHGFELQLGEPLRPTLEARILSLGAARTWYQQRQPRCRSLDGIVPLDDPDRTCAACRVRAQCTAQLRLDLFVDAQPFRLLLAYTSAKNGLLYEAGLRQRGLSIEDRLHRLMVIHRGSWGEVRFRLLGTGEA
jgi:hypothetical protein